ncbi:MAG: hypothetical protein Q7S58_19405 [Candidatus Binatus sp.]|uniref:hypothetical protein n=1 Tax=Candidatus Binatus sp. TaxID=2811406 RepID=UPI00271C31CE|nr:hypothetical protein [Candidatus Binatus sp.]MDO8434570.1 hypothetical protein [Candidatus Binatus sp.]
MNFLKSISRNPFLLAAAIAIAMLLAGLPIVRSPLANAAGKGLDVEVPYEINALKTPGITAPYYLQEKDDNILVSDQAGGIFSVTFGGKVTEVAGKAKIKSPAGLAVGPAGFGTYAGQIFVLASTGDDKAPCEVERIDKSGAVSSFAKLPDAGAPASGCRDLEFGAAGGPFAGKLYAATSGNTSIYAIDSSGKATVFGTYDKPVQFDLTTIRFAPATDSKAANQMLIGMRATMAGASKVGRIAIVAPDGKMKDDVYLVGFIRPTGFAWSPSNFGSYGGDLFIADTGKLVAESDNRDGGVYRVDKGLARPYAAGLMDPTDLKFFGKKIVICDPAEKGKGQGAIVIISSLL